MADQDGRYTVEKLNAAAKRASVTVKTVGGPRPGSPTTNDLYCGPASNWAVQQWNGTSWVAYTLTGYSRDS